MIVIVMGVVGAGKTTMSKRATSSERRNVATKPVEPAPARKRPSPPVVTTEPPREGVAVPTQPDVALAPLLPEECPAVADDVVELETSTDPVEVAIPVPAAEADSAPPAVEGEACDDDAAAVSERQPRGLVQMVRNWLRRAA